MDSEKAEHSWHVDNISAGSILSLVLFTIFINSLDNEVERIKEDVCSLLSIGEGVLGILCPVLAPQYKRDLDIRQRVRQRDYKDDQGPGAPLL